ncbi:MAG TPA: GNAT family N-acetyltransferase [Tenuifilaceae bacterium]|jgi:diamine N-acetyltransferase|nr:GNAT family N-acetyltransferase [Bacteroidales bacterium]HNY09447.1 GNAT family N-acetyltransferase [Tenuifilaceae bacterium]MBP8643801.1 GNAT family N-acetyltransferase [Bacteroidales bacterium]NLI88527.1 GNAT family N-acetyltransferase [Bacteroidales bacterium]HOG72452.1 GNAT family N-acetyltransferase [Tenuifilaceae bacterium]
MTEGVLENNMVKLRAPEPDDVDLLYVWENNMEIWKVSNTITPFSRHLLKKYIETAHLDIWESKQLRLIIEAKDQNALMNVPVGLIDLFDFDPYHLRAGIGILIANQQYRRRGYATEALKLLVRYCFGILQLNQIYCNISADNQVSLQLFKKQGFVEVGVKKSWLKTQSGWEDEVMLQLLNPKPRLPKN